MSPLKKNPSPLEGQILDSAANIELEVIQLQIAKRAAALLSRPPIIATLSGLHVTRARKVYLDVTGEAPIKGQLPSDMSFYVTDLQRHLDSAWLAQVYGNLDCCENTQSDQANRYFNTYELYLKACKKSNQNPSITFDRFFLLVRHVFYSKEITISLCKECLSVKLSVKSFDPGKLIKCPMCHLA